MRACGGRQAWGNIFRATPRTLFPDIERKARETLQGHGVTSQASLRELRKSVDALGVANFTRTGVVSFKLYRMFADHLYSHVKTPERLAEVAADPVPNRHAALHGLVVYATRQSSVNALIMAEYAHLSILAVAQALTGGDSFRHSFLQEDQHALADS